MSQVMPEIVFKLKEETFSLSTSNISSIIELPNITEIPNSSENIRGLIKYRDEIYPLLDSRKILNFPTISDEINDFELLMDQRAHDHKNWLNELENSIKENREFKLTTDPHKCAFGKWYDNYKPSNYTIGNLLEKFDAPHKRIHSIANEIEKLKSKNDFENADSLLQQTRNGDLAAMIKLFGEIKIAVMEASNERVILLDDSEHKCAITVDSVQSVEFLEELAVEEKDEKLLKFQNNHVVESLAKMKNGDLVIRISGSSILNNGQYSEPEPQLVLN